ncbi:hypothetical protein NEOKW01_1070 [Nematocida sp. AWRm80]|nr:hypothetical protein NEOKW01_1070 [Nematocida sp. AWRm80]
MATEAKLKYESVLEQAIVSKNKEFFFKFMTLQEDVKCKMVQQVSDQLIIPLLEVLTEFFERKEMRYEAVQSIQEVLIWRKDTFKQYTMIIQEKDQPRLHVESMNRLKQILATINKEKVDLNRIYELKGRLEYLRGSIEDRVVEKENVPVCREQ